ncbi:MAG: hypothetical protein E7619_04110 [Ruminococcaceae bacterium]|nr:hypothetical protein [Oscillospiraceae bacterium]
MSNSKATRRALLTSILALIMCVSMLIGTTAAWFTDTVTSSGNKVISGTLKVDLEVLEDNDWISIKDNPQAIFDYDNWEPGYVQVKILRVVNKGSLAFKWQASLVANAALGSLADVIDVYVKEDVTAYPTERTEINSWNKVGTLRDFVNTIPVATNGEILAKDKNATEYPSEVLAIAFKMQETAGNEYQDQTLGEFDIQILATQLMAEKDSFDEKYDAEAAWDGTYPTTKPDTLVVDTVNHIISINDTAAFAYLNTLVNDPDFYTNYGSKWKYSIELNTDVDLMNKAWTPILLSNFVAFDGKGHTISNVYVSTTEDDAGLFQNIACNDIGVTYVRNLNIDGAYIIGDQSVGALAGSSSQGVIENVTINNATVIGNKYVGGIFGSGNGSANGCTVKNTTVTIPEGGLKEAGGLIGYVSNDGNPTTENKIIANNTVENVVITAPTIASGLVSQPNSSNTGTGVIVIENNTLKNVKITTADNSADLYVSNNVTGRTIVRNNTAVDCEVGTVIATADALVNAFANLKAGAVLFITDDIDMTGKTIAPVTGNKAFTMYGNGHTISNLNTTERALFVAHSGSSAYVFKDVVLENCSVNSASNYGALFVGDGDTSDEITIVNCHVKNCTVNSAKYAAAFVGYTAGYDVQNNGPVYSDVTIKDCSVTGGSITGGGSTAAAIGHAGGNVDTTSIVENLTVTNVAINGEDAAHTGIAVGTANVGKTIITNVTHSGVTGNYNTATVVYGRFVPGTTGSLTVDGATVNP